MKIITYGDPILRKQSARIENIDGDIVSLIDDMLETLHDADGLGLAAPQVGVSKMLFIVDWSLLDETGSEGNDEGVDIYINPVLRKVDEETDSGDEGCLSLPGVTATVERIDQIEISYQNLDGEDVEIVLKGLPARVVQHEYDHLAGILFIDRISARERDRNKSKLQDILAGRIKSLDGSQKDETGA